VSFVRLAETGRAGIMITVDGRMVRALAGDTVLTALRAAGLVVRQGEFGDGPRAGFCLMGACHDCIVRIEGQGRVRSCQIPAAQGMRVTTDG
jgi:NADH dehydrogenase/NADH:ubiquinone oxidoreductase subunit G